MQILYTANASATGGRKDGHSETDDGRLKVDLSSPKELGGDGGAGTNPEQLFAAGYAACFLGALKAAARKDGTTLSEESRIVAEVGIGKRDDGEGFGLRVGLTAHVPGLDAETVKDLMDRAHVICPYSHAIKGNVQVSLSVGQA